MKSTFKAKRTSFCIAKIFIYLLLSEHCHFNIYSSESDSLNKHLFISAGTHIGNVIKADKYIDNFLKSEDNYIYNMSLGYKSLPSDSNWYASDFNYPTFTAGILIGDFHRIRMFKESSKVDYQSRMGTIVGFYGAFNRRLFNTGNFNMNYTFENGLAYESHPYHPINNVDNELTGSSFLIYFGAGIYANYLISNHWELSAGIEFKHFSNGALDRPNKGVNSVGVGMKINYYFDEQSEQLPKLRFKPFKNHFYYNLSVGIGGKTLLEEWLLYYYSTPKDDPNYRTVHYKIYPAVNVSADIMYQYVRKYGSGIGLDIFYSPYANRIKEIDEAAKREFKHDKCSVGLALKHEVYYNHLALSVSLGYYIHREMGSLDGEDGQSYYERLGLRYYFPRLGNLFIGYHVKAHLTKADLMEFCIGVQL